jgi:hypothetical protein
MSARAIAGGTSWTARWSSPHGLFGDLAMLVFVLVQALDGALTYLGVHTWGPAIEANPLVSSAVSMAGVGAGLMVAKLFAITLGILLHLRQAHTVIAALSAFYIAVAILPWGILFLTVP